MKKLCCFLVLTLLVASLLAGCSTSKNSDPVNVNTENASQTTADKSFTIRVACIGNEPGLEKAQEMFKSKYPNGELKIITSSYGTGGKDLREKQLILISSGQVIDVGRMAWGKEFFRKGVITDITDKVKSLDIYSKYTPGQLERITYEGKIFGVTFSNNCVMLFYNKDILGKLGITEAPKTLDEVVDIARKIKEADLKTSDGKPIYTTVFEGGNWSTDYWLYANGGEQMNSDYTETRIDSPQSIAAFKFMQDFVANGWAPPKDGSGNKLWLNGQLAFWVSGNWDVVPSNDAKLNYGVALMPTGSSGKRTVSIGGAEWAIFTASQYKDEAFEFIKSFVSPEVETEFSRNPANMPLYDDPKKQEDWKNAGIFDAQMIQKEQLQDTTYNFLENPYIYPEASSVYNTALDKILVRLSDVESTMAEAAKDINEGIKKAIDEGR